MRGGTKRNPERKTDGATVGKFAKLLGTPLLPWQQYVADVAGEIDPETGSYFYDTVVLSTQRQCGKSTLIDTEDTRNAWWGPRRFIYYLAQTGNDSNKHFKEYLKKLQASPLSVIAERPYLGAGDRSQPFSNGSQIVPMAVTNVAGHGVQGDKITLDEAFSLSAETGKTILDGFLPTTVTRLRATGVQPQIWITSTEGTADSTFLNPILDGFRAGDVPEHTCWFDWGIPADADPEDLDTIMKYHPAAGLLWDIRQLKRFRDSFKQGDLDDAAGWARAFGNRRDTGVVDRVISTELWNSTITQPIQPSQLDGRKVVISAAVDLDATSTSISAGIKNNDDTTTVQLLKVMQGTGEAPDILLRLCTQYHAPLIMDNRGPNSELRDRLEALKDDYGEPVIEFVRMPPADYLATGQSFVSGLQNGVVLHANDPDLDASAVVCARTWSGDAWRITRRGTTGMTSPLESAILAAWGVAHMPDEDDSLQIY